MCLERTLPRQELLLRKLVAPQNLLHRDPAAMHGSHYRSLATGCPPDGIGGWQIVHWGARNADCSMTVFSGYWRILEASNRSHSYDPTFVGKIRGLPQ